LAGFARSERAAEIASTLSDGRIFFGGDAPILTR
jgi:hypothetical protein